MKASRRKLLIILLVLTTIAVYCAVAIFPNFFTTKGLETDTVRALTIVAHRGGAALGPENTISCIEAGIAAGADAVEIDVHLTSDGFLVVCHDDSVDRTTDGQGLIREMTLEDIRKLKVVDNGRITHEHIPTLGQVLEAVSGRVQLLIEVKRKGNVYAGIEDKLIEEIARHDAWHWVTVQSFNDSVLETLHGKERSLRLEKLMVFKFPGLPIIFDGTFTKFTFDKYSYVSSFNIMYPSASRRMVTEMKRRGFGVMIWTVDDPLRTPRLPVDGIITDRPDVWYRHRQDNL